MLATAVWIDRQRLHQLRGVEARDGDDAHVLSRARASTSSISKGQRPRRPLSASASRERPATPWPAGPPQACGSPLRVPLDHWEKKKRRGRCSLNPGRRAPPASTRSVPAARCSCVSARCARAVARVPRARVLDAAGRPRPSRRRRSRPQSNVAAEHEIRSLRTRGAGRQARCTLPALRGAAGSSLAFRGSRNRLAARDGLQRQLGPGLAHAPASADL